VVISGVFGTPQFCDFVPENKVERFVPQPYQSIGVDEKHRLGWRRIIFLEGTFRWMRTQRPAASRKNTPAPSNIRDVDVADATWICC
jgi:hypothetical protein